MTDFRHSTLQVQGLSVRFGKQAVLTDVSFDVETHSTFALIGTSGCGKTTLLRTIAGLLIADRGSVTLEKKRIDELPTNQRGVVYLNQEPLLFPHLTLFENVAFGVRLRSYAKAAVHNLVEPLLLRLGLEGLGGRYPQGLSGGQRQRVAFGRAIAIEPPLLLLDEPFSNLDQDSRLSMQALFREVSHERGITSVFVTHDLKECLSVGDRFAILKNGKVSTYENRRAFCADPTSGVAREAQFWSEFTDQHRGE